MTTKEQFGEFMRKNAGLDQTDDELWEALRKDLLAESNHRFQGQGHPVTEEELQYAARKILELGPIVGAS